MQQLRVRNLRSLVDSTSIRLRPITLLVGRNSGGKSTFLRTFPLLRQSTEIRTTGPVLWFGPLVDFGDLATAISSFATPLHSASESPTAVSFEFGFDGATVLNRLHRRAYAPTKDGPIESGLSLKFTLTLTPGSSASDSRAPKVLVILGMQFSDQMIELSISHDGDIRSFRVNDTGIGEGVHGLRSYSPGSMRLLPSLSNIDDRTALSPEFILSSNSLHKSFRKILSQHAHGNTGTRRLANMSRHWGLGSKEFLLKKFKGYHPTYTDTWRRNVRDWKINSTEFLQVNDAYLATYAARILESCNSYLSTVFANVAYTAPLRATAQRYHRVRDLHLSEIDSSGENMAAFLHNLPAGQLKEFAAWCRSALGFSVATSATPGHISLGLAGPNPKQSRNLADVGFGLSQLLPVAAQAWLAAKEGPKSQVPKFVCMEQPELHLHPALQADFAVALGGLLVATKSETNLRFVIETHSPTIVNQIGLMVLRGDLSEDDVSIVIFEQENPFEPSTVRTAQFENGQLTGWPVGFFDA